MIRKIFFWIAALVGDATAFNLNSIKTLSAIGVSMFFIKIKPVFSKGLKSLPKNPPDWPILDNCIYDNFILADKPIAKALQSHETCVLVDNYLCGKLVSSLDSPITFDKRFKVTWVPFFVLDFNLFIKLCIWQFYI